jgi:hypothetical protein
MKSVRISSLRLSSLLPDQVDEQVSVSNLAGSARNTSKKPGRNPVRLFLYFNPVNQGCGEAARA